MKTVLIANGPIKNKGKLIDSCDVVIRMHHTDISEHVVHVGSKFDVWVAPYGHVQAWMNPPYEDIEKCSSVWSFNKKLGHADRYLRTRVKNVTAASDLFKKFVGEFVPDATPTKGFYALMMAMLIYDEPIYIAGFSFYKDNRSWFWSDKKREPPLTGYNIPAEKMCIENLIKEGNVKWM